MTLSAFQCKQNRQYTLLTCSTYSQSDEYAEEIENNISTYPKNCSGSFIVSNNEVKPPIDCGGNKTGEDKIKCIPPPIKVPLDLNFEDIDFCLYTSDPELVEAYISGNTGKIIKTIELETVNYDHETELLTFNIMYDELLTEPGNIFTIETPVRQKSYNDKIQIMFSLND